MAEAKPAKEKVARAERESSAVRAAPWEPWREHGPLPDLIPG